MYVKHAPKQVHWNEEYLHVHCYVALLHRGIEEANAFKYTIKVQCWELNPK